MTNNGQDVSSFAQRLDSMWCERRTNWNCSGDIFGTLTSYFNQSLNPYMAFLELVDCLPDQTVESPDTLYNCVWKHFCTWLEQRSRPSTGGNNSNNNARYANSHPHNHHPHSNNNWADQRLRYLTADVLRRAAHVALKNNMKTFTTACALFRFADYGQHQAVVDIFAKKVQELAGERNYQAIATIFDHQIDILSPGGLLTEEVLRKLTLYLICTNEAQIARKVLGKVMPPERVYAVISFIDSIVGAATQLEQDQMVRRELGEETTNNCDSNGTNNNGNGGGNSDPMRFSTQGIYTVATKLTKDLLVPFRYYPNMTFVQLKGTTKFITSATFGADAEMDLATFRESIEDLAEMDDRFPQFVVRYLIQAGYFDEAHFFAEKFKLDEILSSSTFAYWSPDSGSKTSELPPSAFGDMSSNCYQFPLSDDAIISVDSVEKYRSALNHILSIATSASQDHLHRSVGIDTEWTPVHRPDRRQVISILQLALIDRVFIIDIENLSPLLTADDWLLLDNFFKSPDIKKLTYAFKSDLSMLKLSFPEAANLDLTKIVSHVDLEKLTHNVWKALRAVDCGPLSVCNNAVMVDATSTAIPTSLADVARSFLGRRVPKMFRLSNWSRRPLIHGQLLYAAVDAYCLLEIYREICLIIASQRLKVSLEISMLRKGDVALPPELPDLPQVQPGEVRLLCDALLTDVGAYLQQLGFNVEIVGDKTDLDDMAERAAGEQRAIITVPHLAASFQTSTVRVIGVPFGTLQEQADFVASRLNVQINCEDNKPMAPFDPVQRVQQIAARRREDVLYEIQNDPTRPPHEPMFMALCRLVSTVTCDITMETHAVAANKREAKKRAAANMIVKLTASDRSNAISYSLAAPRSVVEPPPPQQNHRPTSHHNHYHYNNNNNSYHSRGENFSYGRNAASKKRDTPQEDFWC